MKFKIGAIICYMLGHDVSEDNEDLLYAMALPEYGITCNCKRCEQSLSLKIDKEDHDFYFVTEA